MLRRLTMVVLLICAAGCSSFDRDWNALAAMGAGNGLDGRWDGTWRSDVNGHSGRLRCIITTDAAGTRHARYRASYAGILSFEYAMPMEVEVDGEIYRFSAEADLGWLAGGRYAYEGTVIGNRFTSTYRSARDHGTFELSRVADGQSPG